MEANLNDCWIKDKYDHKGQMFQDPENPDKVICQSHRDRRQTPPRSRTSPVLSKKVRQCVIVDPGNHGGPIDEQTSRCANHCVEAAAVA
ncbi:MAG: hypothetical protein Q8P13_00235 [bacterium]|nr:hypothetical protein [bacterium]